MKIFIVIGLVFLIAGGFLSIIGVSNGNLIGLLGSVSAFVAVCFYLSTKSNENSQNKG